MITMRNYEGEENTWTVQIEDNEDIICSVSENLSKLEAVTLISFLYGGDFNLEYITGLINK